VIEVIFFALMQMLGHRYTGIQVDLQRTNCRGECGKRLLKSFHGLANELQAS